VPEVKLAAESRTEFGKGAARRLRREHKVPAVLYGHGADPVHIALPGHATMLALKNSNALLSLEVEGKQMLALPKDVQRDPLRGVIEHVDLLIVRRGEMVTVDVPLNVVGETAPDTLVTSEFTVLSIEVEATAIPKAIEVDVDGLGVGAQILARQITLPAGASLVTEADTLVINVSDATVAAVEAEEAEGAESGEAEQAPADGSPERE
jgi:large subunit ribosomal protein L25